MTFYLLYHFLNPPITAGIDTIPVFFKFFMDRIDFKGTGFRNLLRMLNISRAHVRNSNCFNIHSFLPIFLIILLIELSSSLMGVPLIIVAAARVASDVAVNAHLRLHACFWRIRTAWCL